MILMYYGNANLITQTRKPRYTQNIACKNLQTEITSLMPALAIILECLRYLCATRQKVSYLWLLSYRLEISGSSLQEYPISLPPYNTSWIFPIALGPNDSSIRISPKAYSLIPGVSFEIQDISYREMPVKEDNLYIYESNFCLHNANKCAETNKH